MDLKNDFYIVQACDANAKGAVYTVTLNEKHPIYAAHFPGNPITPGVCIIQMVEELLSLMTNHTLSLVTLHNVKFLSTIIPGKTGSLKVSLQADDSIDSVKVKAVIADENVTYTKISATFNKL